MERSGSLVPLKFTKFLALAGLGILFNTLHMTQNVNCGVLSLQREPRASLRATKVLGQKLLTSFVSNLPKSLPLFPVFFLAYSANEHSHSCSDQPAGNPRTTERIYMESLQKAELLTVFMSPRKCRVSKAMACNTRL